MNEQKQNNIELNEDFQNALKILLKTKDNIFVTGKAGTGKTTFLKFFVSKFLKEYKKKFVVLAPTGVAALNAGGETVHSFFKFKIDVTPDKIKKKKSSGKNGKDGKSTKNSIYKNLDLIIIDEVSMLRADLLDCVDRFLRFNGPDETMPFGGIQMLFIGDLLQLPPVVSKGEEDLFRQYYKTPYFLSAKCMQDVFCHVIEFTKVYRQTDEKFLDILNAIRENNIDDETLELLNKNVVKITNGTNELKAANIKNTTNGTTKNSVAATSKETNFKAVSSENKKLSIYLTGTNKLAEFYNNKFLKLINGMEYTFKAETEEIENVSVFPASYELRLKIGAQIMMLNNDANNRWVNGSIGVVEDIMKAVSSDKYLIYVKMQNGKTEVVDQHTWELIKYKWNPQKNAIETEKNGSFCQYPLKLAWAVTIHKSQGKTFDNVFIDLGFGGAFAPGQMYVALSRCRELAGIKLKHPLKKEDIFVDRRIKELLKEREQQNGSL